jgi:hypothetical protein
MNLCENRTVDQKPFEFDGRRAIIPWAEGNGLWRRMTQLASSLSGVDILTFFAQNPHSCDSAEELAVRIGRQTTKVGPVLEQLRLADDPYHRQTLQQFVLWLQEGYHWARMGMEQ